MFGYTEMEGRESQTTGSEALLQIASMKPPSGPFSVQ